jgi:O-methyltransferase
MLPTVASKRRQFTWRGRLLRALLARRGASVVHMIGPQARRDLAIVRETRKLAPLLVQDVAAYEILACVRAASRLDGTMAEAGVFAGGTARLICEAKGNRPLRLFDVLETLQGPPHASPETHRITQLRRRFGKWHAARADVERLLAAYPAVYIHSGVFPDTATELGHDRFSFVHIDLDMQQSTRDALEFFYPRLLIGGILIGDDYNDREVRRAFDDYFSGRDVTVIPLPWGQAIVVKA